MMLGKQYFPTSTSVGKSNIYVFENLDEFSGLCTAKYYFDFKGTKHLIARSGWSKQGGYEVYVQNTSSGQKLYDHLFEVGKEFNVGPGCPNLIERIESALLSYGNDFDNNDNPFECGFDLSLIHI